MLSTPILKSIGARTFYIPGIWISDSEVIGDIQAQFPSASTTQIRWTATQLLQSKGLVQVNLTYGLVALTPQGCVEAENLSESLDTQPVLFGDEAGQSIYTDGLPNNMEMDSYAVAIVAQNTSCFGDFDSEQHVCLTCPISVPCRSQLFSKLSTYSRSGIVLEKMPDSLDESMSDILKELEEETKEAEHKGELTKLTLDSVCYICRAPLPEGTIVVHVAGKGVRHQVWCGSLPL